MSRTLLLTAALAAFLALPVPGGPELVAFPAGDRETFVLYNKVDRPDRRIVRFMHASPAAVAAARPDEPLPPATVLIMEDRKARPDGDSAPRDDQGRLLPTDEITNVFVMEKQPGWGAHYPPEKRNGEWEYAHFQPDGTPSPTPGSTAASPATRAGRARLHLHLRQVRAGRQAAAPLIRRRPRLRAWALPPACRLPRRPGSGWHGGMSAHVEATLGRADIH